MLGKVYVYVCIGTLIQLLKAFQLMWLKIWNFIYRLTKPMSDEST